MEKKENVLKFSTLEYKLKIKGKYGAETFTIFPKTFFRSKVRLSKREA